MKNVNIMGVHQFLGEWGSQKNNIYGELPKKGLGKYAKGLAKNKEETVFEGVVDTSMHTDLILVHAGT